MVLYELDPAGDVTLSLSDPRPSFAVWDESRCDRSCPPDSPALNLVNTYNRAAEKKGKNKKKAYRGNSAHPSRLCTFSQDVLTGAPPLRFDSPATLSPPFDEPPSPREPLNDDTGEGQKSPFPACIAAAVDHNTVAPSAPTQLEEAHECVKHVEIRVSSRHLILASPYWARMLNGQLKEATTLKERGCVTIPVEGVDADALLALMQVVHGKTRDVPRTVSLEMLAKIAVAVDLYECYEAVDIFVSIWLTPLRLTFPTAYSRDTVLWIFVSHVFKQHDEFKQATRLVLMHSCSSIQDWQLPISSNIVGAYDSLAMEMKLTSFQTLSQHDETGLFKKLLTSYSNLRKIFFTTRSAARTAAVARSLGQS